MLQSLNLICHTLEQFDIFVIFETLKYTPLDFNICLFTFIVACFVYFSLYKRGGFCSFTYDNVRMFSFCIMSDWLEQNHFSIILLLRFFLYRVIGLLIGYFNVSANLNFFLYQHHVKIIRGFRILSGVYLTGVFLNNCFAIYNHPYHFATLPGEDVTNLIQNQAQNEIALSQIAETQRADDEYEVLWKQRQKFQNATDWYWLNVERDRAAWGIAKKEMSLHVRAYQDANDEASHCYGDPRCDSDTTTENYDKARKKWLNACRNRNALSDRIGSTGGPDVPTKLECIILDIQEDINKNSSYRKLANEYPDIYPQNTKLSNWIASTRVGRWGNICKIQYWNYIKHWWKS